jgi:histidyl-tRNA synthetase
MNNQLKRADKIGAKYALIIGSEFPEVELKTMASRQSVRTDLEGLLTELLPDAE